MSTNSAKFLVAGALAALMAGGMGSPSMAQTADPVVNCFYEALGTVQSVRASQCDGNVVADEKAATVRQERRAYIRRILAKPSVGNVTGKNLAGLGSGFFVGADGTVVTSRHVVEDCAAVSVTPTFGEMKLAKTITPSRKADLALLRTDLTPPGVAPLVPREGPAVIGQAFIAGYPELGPVTIKPILTDVEVLHRESWTPFGPAIVIKGNVRKGYSGGPLLDGGGDVIGVVVAKANSVNIYQVTGEVVRDIGLALSGEVLQNFLDVNGIVPLEAPRRPPQPNGRILDNIRPFMAQIGCWK